MTDKEREITINYMLQQDLRISRLMHILRVARDFLENGSPYPKEVVLMRVNDALIEHSEPIQLVGSKSAGEFSSAGVEKKMHD